MEKRNLEDVQYDAPPPAYTNLGAQPGDSGNPPMVVQGPGQPTQVFVQVAHSLPPVPYPVTMTCPHCRQNVVTQVAHESGVLTWLAAGGLALLGCIFGCCLIPFCVDGCKDVIHTCPQCGQYIGTYRRIH